MNDRLAMQRISSYIEVNTHDGTLKDVSLRNISVCGCVTWRVDSSLRAAVIVTKSILATALLA